MAKRSSIYDDAAETDKALHPLDLSRFQPEPEAPTPAIDRDRLKEISEASNFPSRQPNRTPQMPEKPGTPKREPRIHRTGRNVQFNVKASQATIDACYAISNQQGWVLGETLEHALSALQRELEGQGKAL
jgi:hypothetical protein